MTKEEKDAKAAKKVQKAAKKIANDKLKDTKTKAQEQGLDTVECICSNVHVGGGQVLRAYRESNKDNWADGDVAQIPHADAVFLAKRKQVKIL